MNENTHQPSLSSTANESATEIRTGTTGISPSDKSRKRRGRSASNEPCARYLGALRILAGENAFATEGRARAKLIWLQPTWTVFGANIHALSMPEIKRLSMLPNLVERNPLIRLWGRLRGKANNSETRRTAPAAMASQKTITDWRKTAASRRLVLGALILLQTTVATWSLSNTFPYPWLKASEIAILLLFAILFSWISLGFWSAVAGFWMLWSGTNEFTIA